MLPLPLLLAGGGALLGGLVGGQGSQQTQSTEKQLAPETELEKLMQQLLQGGMKDMQGMVNAGPGMQDVQAGLSSQRSLADMLAQYSQSGGMPTQADMAAGNSFAQQMFAPQQTQLEQGYQGMQQDANRASARMGRAANDPVMMAKLAQGQMQQQQQLSSQMTAYGADFANQMSNNRVNFAGQLAQVNGNLAAQAMANRQTLLSMGNQLKSQDQSFRAGTANSTTTYAQPGGLAGALNGALAGAGTLSGIASSFGGGNQATKPTATPTTQVTGGSYKNFGNFA